MEADELPNVDLNVDYETILPIQQKRTITFINNFIMNTISFLNQFSQSCESRLMEFEYKMQKLEASLLILESQLSSIPDTDNNSYMKDSLSKEDPNSQDTLELPDVINNTDTNVSNDQKEEAASKDPRFARFFKMVQVGVPIQAVKNKMKAENLDPSILDKFNDTKPA